MMGVWPRINALTALAAAKGVDEATIKKFEAFGNQTSSISKRRNRFVHDAWYFSNEGEPGQFVSFSEKDRHYGIKSINEEAALTLTTDIKSRLTRLAELKTELMGKLPALRDKPR